MSYMNKSAIEKITFVFIFILIVSFTSSAQIILPNKNVTAFVGVNVIPMDKERVLQNQTVIVRNGKVDKIGAAGKTKVPKDAEIIQGSGAFLMPGLADMHFHINDASGQLLEQVLVSLIAGGVTTVRDMNGFPGHLQIREEIKQGKRLGPVIFAAGRITDSIPLRPYFRIVKTPQEARQAVIDDKKAGYDFFKVYSLLSADSYNAIVDEARKVDMPVVGHVPTSIGLMEALRAKQKSIEHLFSYCEAARSARAKNYQDFRELFHALEIDESLIPELAKATRKAGTWNTPTLFYAKTRLPFEGARKAWEQPGLRELGEHNRNLIVRSLQTAGAKILLGTDSSASWYLIPGFSTHEELKLLVEAGLTPYEAIRAGTSGAAEFLGNNEFGTIGKGKRADFILLKSNPLQDIKSIGNRIGVMVKGKWYSSEMLSKMLSDLELNPDGTRRKK